MSARETVVRRLPMASDTHLANAIRIAAHKSLGFHDELPTVRFHKWLE
jgi:hypothetical protein